MSARFVQIHTLTHYPASLLNRDDAGFAKRMPFGGAVRTRVSSQCLKRHWRVYDGENGLGTIDAPDSIRSRVAFERFVVEPLVDKGFDKSVARAATENVVGKLFGSEAKEAKKDRAQKTARRKSSQETISPASAPEAAPGQAVPSVPDPVSTKQVTVLGRPELDYLFQLILDAINASGGAAAASVDVEREIDKRFKDQKELKKNLQALKPGSLSAGLGAALFGRMVTGDILSRTDAAIHVAHSMTVHGQMTESDYFTAIDDLVRDEGEQASGHINSSELTSGLFYGYLVVDVNGLVSNLGGDRALAGDVVHRLLHIVTTVSPGAKKGSTAPYAYSHLALVESGKAQPRTLSNAFIEPVRTAGDVVQNAYSALRRHLVELDSMYGKAEHRAHAGLFTTGASDSQETAIFEGKMSLSQLADWTREQVVA